MTQPSGTVRPPVLDVNDQLRELTQRVDALTARALRSAGEFSTLTPAGVKTFHTGPNYAVPAAADGTPQWTTEMYDQLGNLRLQLFSPFALAAPPQTISIFDHLGNTVFATDAAGGVAIPWQPIVLYPKFAVAAGAFQYMSIGVNVTETDLWAGKIGKLLGPKIGLTGVWGAASGTNTTRYRMKLNGNTIGTWDIVGLTVSTQGPFNLTPTAALGSLGADIIITAQTLSGTGTLACQLVDCQMRQT